MSELKIRKGPGVRKADFENFAKDLELILDAFTPQLLGEWMKKHKGNLSNKLNVIEPISPKDILHFYATVSSALEKLKNGVPAYQWEEIRLLKEKLLEHDAAIRELRSGKEGP